MSARQRSYAPPIKGEQLQHFGFSDAEAAAEEVNELLKAVFGPADEAARAVWQMLLDEEELAPKAMASFLRQAAGAPDPLAFVGRDATALGLLNARMRDLGRQLAAGGEESPVEIHPSVAELYRRKVAELQTLLQKGRRAWTRWMRSAD